MVVRVPNDGIEACFGENSHGFAYFEDQGQRPTQEDALVCISNIELSHLEPEAVAHRLWSTHRILDATFSVCAGSTATSTVYDGQGNIITATLGDASSFAVVYDTSGQHLKTLRLNSKIHRPTEKKEISRIQSLNGLIMHERVYGNLAISRAIGDNSENLQGFNVDRSSGRERIQYNGKPLIIADSSIDITNINTLMRPCKTAVGRIELIATCDGFTDGAGQQQQQKHDHERFMQQCIEEANGLHGVDLCRFLCKKAQQHGSSDNISIALQTIFLDGNALKETLLLGVYDGHGGDEASTFIANNIEKIFRSQCALSLQDYAAGEHSVAKHIKRYICDHPTALQHHLLRQYNLQEVIKMTLEKCGYTSAIEKLTQQYGGLLKYDNKNAAQAMDVLLSSLMQAKEKLFLKEYNPVMFIKESNKALHNAQCSCLGEYHHESFLINKIILSLNWLSLFICGHSFIKNQSIKCVDAAKLSIKNFEVQNNYHLNV